MSWKKLDNQLFNLLNDNKTSLDIYDVQDKPSTDFDGFPSITITPANYPNEYNTNVENQRIFTFDVRIFYETENTGVGTAKDNLLNVADGVMDLLDREVHADDRTIGVDLDSKYVFIDIEPVPGNFYTMSQEHMVFLELTVKIKLSVNLV
jgi:hypothetical protein